MWCLRQTVLCILLRLPNGTPLKLPSLPLALHRGTLVCLWTKPRHPKTLGPFGLYLPKVLVQPRQVLFKWQRTFGWHGRTLPCRPRLNEIPPWPRQLPRGVLRAGLLLRLPDTTRILCLVRRHYRWPYTIAKQKWGLWLIHTPQALEVVIRPQA